MHKMSIDTTLKVTEIQRFCMHDGPGVRTTVFLKGCHLRCPWCHNPETKKRGGELLFYAQKCIGCGACADVCPRQAQIFSPARTVDRNACVGCGACAEVCPAAALALSGRDMTVKEILAQVLRDRAFYGQTGGVTLSGGEPFLQREKTLALLRACREEGLHTAVETSGYADAPIITAAAEDVDLFLWDIKDTDEWRHSTYVGAPLGVILSNLRAVDALGAKIRLRCIIIRGVNDEISHYDRVAELALSLTRPAEVEVIPYHAYGGGKAVFLGEKDNGRADWIPSEEEILQAKERIRAHGVYVF